MRLSEMEKHYPTQKHCYDLLEDLVWNYKPTCPTCYRSYVLYTTKNHYRSKDTYKCGGCGRNYSVTKSTIFHYSRVPLVKWFTAIHYIKTAKRKPTGVGLAQLIDVDRSTARRMFKKILADLEIDRYNSLSAQIYEYNRQLERFWF